MNNPSTHHSHSGWLVFGAVVLVLILLSLGIPSVRAALSAWLGLSVAPSNQMPAVSITLVAVTPPTPASVAATASPATSLSPTDTPATQATVQVEGYTRVEGSTGTPVDLSQLSSQAGWKILTPSRLPEGYQLQSAYFDANQSMLILTYLASRPLPGNATPPLTEHKTITLLQALKNDFVPMEVAPKTNVSDVQVNGQPAAFAQGAWDTEFVKDTQQPNGGSMLSTWRNDLPVKNLYWQDGKIYLVLVTDDGAVSQQNLIDMAASTGGR